MSLLYFYSLIEIIFKWLYIKTNSPNLFNKWINSILCCILWCTLFLWFCCCRCLCWCSLFCTWCWCCWCWIWYCSFSISYLFFCL